NPKMDLAILVWEWGSYLGNEGMEKGVTVRTSSYTRNHVNSLMSKAKANGNYLNSILAVQEAAACGCNEALLLDHEGYVAEGSGENIFIVRRGKLYTPDLTSALEGITRETVMTIAKEQGIEVIEKRITRDEVYIADEAFFTGTAAEVTPIRVLDGRQIGSGSRGSITTKLQALYFDYVYGRRDDHTEWLSY
ncbi:MAG: branched-chain-amino-acid transaminase, partial [Desulfuromonadaceae bacterium]